MFTNDAMNLDELTDPVLDILRQALQGSVIQVGDAQSLGIDL